MDAVYYWSLLLGTALILGLLLKLLKCCEKVYSQGGGGGGPSPIPILGTVYDNTPTKAGGCAQDGADTLLAGWTVTITPSGAATPTHTLTTNSQGRFGTLLDPGDYVVELQFPAAPPPPAPALGMCPGMTNPRSVTVPASGTAVANFAVQT